MIYYARPFSFNPKLARIRYMEESNQIHLQTGEWPVSTVPMTDFENSDIDEQEIFDVAEMLIKESDMLIFKGDSKGVRKEKAIARKYEVEVKEYCEVIL
jgi:hypothetical protein